MVPRRARTLLALIANVALGCQLLLDTASEPSVTSTEDASGGVVTLDGAAGQDASDGGPGSELSYSASVLGDGPFAYWTFDDETGPVKDLVGGRVLVQEGAIKRGVPGVAANAIEFSGTSFAQLSYDDPANTFDLLSTAPFTVEVWIRADRLKAGANTFLQRRRDAASPSNGFIGFVFGTDAGATGARARFELWAADEAGRGASRTAREADISLGGAFVHVVFTLIPEDALREYVNGEFISQGKVGTLGPSPMQYPMLVGDDLIGALDELAFYGKALSANQIRAHYDVGRRAAARDQRP